MSIRGRRHEEAQRSAARSMTSVAALAATLGLSACSGGYEAGLPSLGIRQAAAPRPGPIPAPRMAQAPNPSHVVGGYKLGQPYRIGNVWYVPREEPGYDRRGVASWYGADFHGHATANGETYNMHALTAAHPTLPLPSYVTVTNRANNRTILVRVNDRGPYVGGRLIDLSRAAAGALGYDGRGTADVEVRYVGRAPLNGNTEREQRFLADQPWSQSQVAQGPFSKPGGSPAPQLVASPQAARSPVTDQGPVGGSWSADGYRRTAAQPQRPKEPVSSWRPSWGLGLGGQ